MNPEIQPIFDWSFGCTCWTSVLFSCRLSRLGTCLHFCREPAESKTHQWQRSSLIMYQPERAIKFHPQGYCDRFFYLFIFNPLPSPVFQPFNCAIRVRTKELPLVSPALFCSVFLQAATAVEDPIQHTSFFAPISSERSGARTPFPWSVLGLWRSLLTWVAITFSRMRDWSGIALCTLWTRVMLHVAWTLSSKRNSTGAFSKCLDYSLPFRDAEQ